MRRTFIAGLVLIAGMPAAFADAPKTMMIGSSIYHRVGDPATGVCESPNSSGVVGDVSTVLFQRDGAGDARVTLPTMTDQRYQTTHQMVAWVSGAAILKFRTASSGVIRQTMSPDETGLSDTWEFKDTQFSGYTQSYNPANFTLTVKFKIQFPDCILPFHGAYHG